VFLQDRALEPFNKPVRPRMPWLRPGVAQAQGATGLIERAVELGAAVGEHAPQAPAGPAVERQHDPPQEVSGGRRGVCGQQPGYAVGARDLPDLAHAFELPDVEGVQTHQFAGLAGGHMPRLAVLGPPQGAARPLGQQPRRLQGAVLDGEAAAARAPTRPLPVLGEGVLPEELMLDVQRQIADPALHTESVVGGPVVAPGSRVTHR
jgi:hypothetical protein